MHCAGHHIVEWKAFILLAALLKNISTTYKMQLHNIRLFKTVTLSAIMTCMKLIVCDDCSRLEKSRENRTWTKNRKATFWWNSSHLNWRQRKVRCCVSSWYYFPVKTFLTQLSVNKKRCIFNQILSPTKFISEKTAKMYTMWKGVCVKDT